MLQNFKCWIECNKGLLPSQFTVHGSIPNLFNTGAFYYMLGNLQPMYRSTTRTIQLLAVAKTADLKKYGMGALLTPVTGEINQLAKVFNNY